MTERNPDSPMTTPFHGGETEAQARAGVAHLADASGRFIRDHMPDQHRDFFAALPFLVVAGADAAGRRWVSVVEPAEGEVTSPDPRTLTLPATLGPGDPLASGYRPGAALGLLGIELATRRRNRANGRLRWAGRGLALDVAQSFGNCPQYIREREWFRDAARPAGPARQGDRLTPDQAKRIAAADTMFVGSGLGGAAGGAAGGEEGFDASHRGGALGFVQVTDARTLRIPDYAGNNFFNTIGNLVRDNRIGLLFVDFASGGLLHLTGRARIVWDGSASRDPQARREIVVAVERVVDRPRALALRWRGGGEALGRFRITHKIAESAAITSFHLAPADGGPAPRFVPGQYLPVAIPVPGQGEPVRRSYSLSGPAGSAELRISVKREPRGLASRALHDYLAPGDVIEAGAPAGDFLLPDGAAPLVLLGAGVGVTPLMAMLHGVAQAAPHRPVAFLHGVRDGSAHAFRGEVAALARNMPNLRAHAFHSAPRPEDRPLPVGVAEGRLTAQEALALSPGPDASYMICGPTGFIAAMIEGLSTAGISPDRIRHESFGPAG